MGLKDEQQSQQLSDPLGSPLLKDDASPDVVIQEPKFTGLTLTLFIAVNSTIFFDRGIFSAMLQILETKYDLTNFEGGLLAAVYMVGYTASSFLFAHLARKYKPKNLIAFGLLMWIIAGLVCAVSINYYILLLGRAISGIGEAAFLCFASTFIDKFSPIDKRSAWLSYFYAAVPIGIAAGNILGGTILNMKIFGDNTWRSLFILEGILMVPSIFFIRRLEGNYEIVPDGVHTQRQRKNSAFLRENESSHFIRAIKALFSNKSYMFVTLGYAVQTFTVGVFAVLGVTYVQKFFGFDEFSAGTSFGGVTAGTGLFGTAFGGIVLNYMVKDCNTDRERFTQAVKLITILQFIGWPIVSFAFIVRQTPWFFAFTVLGELLVFACLSPTNSALLWSLPFEFRPQGSSVCILFQHLLGDAISPALVGIIVDKTGSWPLAMFIAAQMLAVATVLWGLSWRESLLMSPPKDALSPNKSRSESVRHKSLDSVQGSVVAQV